MVCFSNGIVTIITLDLEAKATETVLEQAKLLVDVN